MPKKTEKEKADIMVVKDETVDVVLSRVQEFQTKGELDLPANYSAANALKSAWLLLQRTVDKDKRPVLEVCTKASIANALLDMVVQGLNPSKMQCYFIAYGSILTLSRSYLGNKAICLRVDPVLLDIYAECVYAGDDVEYEIVLGQRHIIHHKQKLINIDGGKILAAYAIAVTKEGEAKRTELMTITEIRNAWSQSRMKPITDKGDIKAGTTHFKFTAEMAKKTVTNRMTKHIIGASSDETLELNKVTESVLRTDDLAAQADAQSEVSEKANQGEIIDIKETKKPAKPAKPAKEKASKPAPKKATPDPEQQKAKNEPLSDEEKEAIALEERLEAEREVQDHLAHGRPPF